MPNSLKSRLKGLVHKGLLSEKDLSRIYTDNDVVEKLESLKAEIREWYWQADKQKLSEDACVVDAMTDLFIRTVDNHISELKGEQKHNEHY